TITKAITISSEGFEAGVLVSGTNAIIISAGTNDVVTLRGLDFNGLGTGLSAIRFISGKALHVQNCQIYGFTQQGIDFEPNQLSALLTVSDSNIHENGNGILIKPVAPGNAKVAIDRVRMENNSGDGFKADTTAGAIAATLRESTMVANGGNGIHSFAPGANPSLIMVDHCSAQNQSGAAPNGNGILSETTGSSNISITDNAISGNRVGVAISGGAFTTFNNNHISGNTTNSGPGAPAN